MVPKDLQVLAHHLVLVHLLVPSLQPILLVLMALMVQLHPQGLVLLWDPLFLQAQVVLVGQVDQLFLGLHAHQAIPVVLTDQADLENL